MSEARYLFGLLGERIAARWFLRQGWEFLAHRYRSGKRDIDLIFRHGSTIAFIEVKARHGLEFGSPVEAVQYRKQREIIKSAQTWRDRYGQDWYSYRFDVLGVLVTGDKVRIRHIPGAFTRGK